MKKRVLFSGPLVKHRSAHEHEREKMREAGRELREREEAERAAAKEAAFDPPPARAAQIVPAPYRSGSRQTARRTRCLALPALLCTRGGDVCCDERTIAGRPLWKLALGAIVALVANTYEIPMEDLWKGGRKKPRPAARNVVWYILRERYNVPLAEIGRVFGRHHTTVLAGIQKVEQAMERVGSTSRRVAQVLYELNGEV